MSDYSEITLSQAELDPIVRVHVENFETDVAPDHFVAMTFTDIGKIIEAVQLNPVRDSMLVSVTGAGTATFCHSQADAQGALGGLASAGFSVTNVAAAQSITFQLRATAKLWLVLSGTVQVSILTESRSN